MGNFFLSVMLSFRSYVYEDAERQWEHYDKDNDGSISWEEYKKGLIGTVDGAYIGVRAVN